MRKLAQLTFTILALALVSLVASAPAQAQTVIDPQIFFCQSGPCLSPPGTDPVIITNTASISVGVAGSFTLQNPLIIIIGVYNGTSSTTAPTVSFSGCTIPSNCPVATIGTYGLTANKATMTSGQDALTQLGLTGDGSESFGNWACGKNGCPGTGGDLGLGLAMPSSFELFAFQLSTNLTSGSPITIDISGVPIGSYIISYDCENGTGSNTSGGIQGGCAKPGDIGQTPYTNSGLVGGGGQVPEPGSLALLGTGLLALGGAIRRRWSNS